MLYFLAILLPPIGVACTGRVGALALNLILCLFGWVPGIIHAIVVVGDHHSRAQHGRVMRAIGHRRELTLQTSVSVPAAHTFSISVPVGATDDEIRDTFNRAARIQWEAARDAAHHARLTQQWAWHRQRVRTSISVLAFLGLLLGLIISAPWIKSKLPDQAKSRQSTASRTPFVGPLQPFPEDLEASLTTSTSASESTLPDGPPPAPSREAVPR